MLTRDQVAATQKSNVDRLFNLSNKAVEGIEQFVQLNMQPTRSMLANTLDLTQKALSEKEPLL